MIIPLQVANIAGAKRAYLRMSVRAPQIRTPLLIDAVIDTGSPYYLIVSYSATIKSQFPFTKSRPEEIIPIGGGKIEAHSIKGSKLTVLDSEKKAVLFTPQTIYFSVPTSKKEINKTEVYSMPNLLGTDFLEHNYIFVFNPAKNKAYIEKEEV